MRRWWTLLVVAVTACTSVQGHPVSDVSARPFSTASPPKTSPTPTASIAPTPPRPLPTPTRLASVFGACRLPVQISSSPDGTPAGWLDVPGGSYTPDPASNGRLANGAISWDQAVGKWIPASPERISPDGTRYISDKLAVVDARTGATIHRFTFPNWWPNRYVAYTNSAIYMGATGKDPPPGLWKVDTATWTLSQVSSAGGWWVMADDRAVWGVDGYTVVRFDVATRKVTTVYKDSDFSTDGVVIAGLVGSGALVTVSQGGISNTPEIVSVSVLHSDGSLAPVYVPRALQYAAFDGEFQDGPTVLLGVRYPTGPNLPPPERFNDKLGLAAFDLDHGLRFVVANTPNVSIAGPCVS